jgi:hypothetical protein
MAYAKIIIIIIIIIIIVIYMHFHILKWMWLFNTYFQILVTNYCIYLHI